MTVRTTTTGPRMMMAVRLLRFLKVLVLVLSLLITANK
jgi:hypothetical protein